MSFLNSLKTFTADLSQLTAEVTLLGGLAEAQVSDAVTSVERRDVALARMVIDKDARLDAMHREIERKAIALISSGSPAESDLRHMLAAIKVSLDLQRTGRLARNIAKRALSLAEGDPMTPMTRSIARMGRLVGARLRDVLDAYTAGNVDLAILVRDSDEEVDEHYNALFRELLTYMMGDARMIGACAHLLFMAKNLERIGDHATNIAETVHYSVTGAAMTAGRPRWESVTQGET